MRWRGPPRLETARTLPGGRQIDSAPLPGPRGSRESLGSAVAESARCAMSSLPPRRRLRRVRPKTFEDWVVGRFGRRLYDAFFRSYTEKVWGIPGSEIRSEWAAQRIKNFSLFKALLTILRLRRQHVTTLIEEFRYPRLGPGQMWEALRARGEERGLPVLTNHRCVAVRHPAGRPAGWRPSAPEARAWPGRERPASASSTSASRVTRSGTWRRSGPSSSRRARSPGSASSTRRRSWTAPSSGSP